MKTTTTFAVAAATLLQLTAAQPHAIRRRAHDHVERDVLVTIVNTVYAQATSAPHVIVYVDEHGVPQSTVTSYPAVQAAPTPAPVVVEAAPAVQAPKVNKDVAAAPAAAVTSTAAAASESDAGFGFSYSPYNGDHSCKSQEQVDEDFRAIGSGYSVARIYGTDCGQVAKVLSACKDHKLKLFAGIWDINSVASEAQIIIDAANGDWSDFDTISVGNEVVNSGRASAEAVVAAIGTARGIFKNAKYPGKIVTVDTLVATREHPSLCDASDYCAVNCHPFFDDKTAAEDSGNFLKTQIPTLQAKLADSKQRIVITETGWPSKGESHGPAIPSVENQAAAISSIKSAFESTPSDIILFTAFNTMWKSNTPDQFMAEEYWGFLGDNPTG